MSVCQNLGVLRRSTKTFELIFTNKIDKSPKSISGWTFYFTAKTKMEDSDAQAVINKVITDLTEPTIGKTLISLSPDDTDLEPKTYWTPKFL